MNAPVPTGHRSGCGRTFRTGLALAWMLCCFASVRGDGPDDESVYREGRHVYERNCLICHGRWGDGRGEMAQGMIPKPRRFSAARFKYRSTPSGFLPTDDDLVRTIRTGIANTAMPAFGHLSDRELRAVVFYVKSFSTRWRKPDALAPPVTLEAIPAWWDRPSERAAHAEAGAGMYRSLCAPCHGESGRGDGPAAAELVDERDEPAPPSDLTRPLWSSGPGPIDLFRTLTTGLDGTPMPSFAEAIPPGQRWDLVAWLDTLRRREAL